LTVVVTSGATTLYSGTLAAMSSPIVAPALPAGASAGFTFAVTLQSGLGSTYQGLTASMPLTWAFGS
jgi:hypothetical protein